MYTVYLLKPNLFFLDTKEDKIPIYDKPHHTNKRIVELEEIDVLRNCALYLI